MMGFNSTSALDTLRTIQSYNALVWVVPVVKYTHLKYHVIKREAIVCLYSNLSINPLFQVTWEATERKSEAKDLDLGPIQLSKSELLMEKGIPRSYAVSLKS